jgi:hypothetical protein
MPDETTPTRSGRTVPDVTEFATHFLQLDRGKVHDDATARLAELVAAVEHTAKGGELTIKITVEPRDPETFPDNHELFLEGEVKISKMPQLKRAPSIFYIAPGKGQITRVDPNRDDLR